MQIWGYCVECAQWFACLRHADGTVADWGCPVCGLPPVSVEQRIDDADEPLGDVPGRRPLEPSSRS